MSERLLTAADAGPMLGGLHPDDVLRLVRDGKLRGKRQIVRGTGKRPRVFILASEVERYIRELPEAAGKTDAREMPRRRRNLKGLAAEIEAAPKRVRSS